MRISDWSSDVCSSVLSGGGVGAHVDLGGGGGWSSPCGQEAPTGARTLSASRVLPRPKRGAPSIVSSTRSAGTAPLSTEAAGSLTRSALPPPEIGREHV